MTYMLDVAQYSQAFSALLDDVAGDLTVVGAIPDDFDAQQADRQALLAQNTAHSFTDLPACLASDSGYKQGGRVLLMIDGESIDTLTSQLGAICQRYPTQVLVELHFDRRQQTFAQSVAQPFFALGFRQALQGESDLASFAVFEYRLEHYKKAPDWLNSRFWAHPERFNAD